MSDMTETRVGDAEMSANIIELNNNNAIASAVEKLNHSFYDNYSRLSSVSSVSSYHSDSEDNAGRSSRRSSGCDIKPEESKALENAYKSKGRSLSDIGTYNNLCDDSKDIRVFPSLPDSVLEKMGLFGRTPRDRLSDEELEQKFISLSLAFTIDSTTIKDRCERQRRYRDQTETNFSVEIERLIQRANRIQPLCVDSETTELLSGLLSQIELVSKAAALATIAGEKYGAVQHEERLSESVAVMINHVHQLKQQRDSARRQLQYTKRMLQDSNCSENITSKQLKTLSSGSRQLTRRRASIATFSQTPEPSNHKTEALSRKVIRRTSELSLKASSLTRSTRPGRLELGVDLVKIKEGSFELDNVPNDDPKHNIEYTLRDSIGNHFNNEVNEEDVEGENSDNSDDRYNYSELSLRDNLNRHISKLQKKIKKRFKRWSSDDTLHEFFCFCALICFSISLIKMAGILIEYEFAKRGITSSRFSWFLNFFVLETQSS